MNLQNSSFSFCLPFVFYVCLGKIVMVMVMFSFPQERWKEFVKRKEKKHRKWVLCTSRTHLGDTNSSISLYHSVEMKLLLYSFLNKEPSLSCTLPVDRSTPVLEPSKVIFVRSLSDFVTRDRVTHLHEESRISQHSLSSSRLV